MVSGGMFADEEALPNLAVCEALGNESQDFALAVREWLIGRTLPGREFFQLIKDLGSDAGIEEGLPLCRRANCVPQFGRPRFLVR